MSPEGPEGLLLITREDELTRIARRLGERPRVAVDLEANGMHAYRAAACIVQLASEGEIVIVDALATPLAPLAELLASPTTEKIVHDVTFDARLLGDVGVRLANVRDTSVAARMLSRPATGLASLLESELGVRIDKKLQHHDWGERPLTRAMVEYLAKDVAHLSALADRLFADVATAGIAAEVEEETRYRLAQASASVGNEDPRPPYVRIKGIERAPAEDLPILRHLANIREALARELDVPPYKVLGADVLFEIARTRPETQAHLAKIPGATGGRRARSIGGELLDAVAAGLEDCAIPDADRVWFEKPRIPGGIIRARRAREQRLTQWRKQAAKQRGVDEQVVLPGHCLQDLADLQEPTRDAIATVAGLGAFRIERDLDALMSALGGAAAAAPAPENAS